MSFSDIVILYGPTWDAPSQVSKHHLARYWARSRRVLYIESPPNPLSFFTRREETVRLWRRYRRGPIQVAERLWVHTFFYPLPYRGSRIGLGGQWVNALNQAVICPQLQRILRRLGFEHPVLFIGSAYGLPLIDSIPHCLLVYHCSDDYTLVPSFPASFPNLEAELIRRCDVVIATAEKLRQAKLHLNPNTFTVPNGAEVEHFAQTQNPKTQVAPELADLPRPVIGYVGSVFRWIDQEMVAYAARQRPQWSFVFIGPIQTDTSVFRPPPNIHFLGPRPYEHLPSYLRGFDVVTIPFVVNDVTLRASPVKFYEYLASGVPVVATRLPEFESFERLVYLVKTPEEFVIALEQAVQNDSPQFRRARMAEARNYSWDARFMQIENILAEALAARQHNAHAKPHLISTDR